MSSNIIFQIRKKYSTLRPSEKKVADTILSKDFDIESTTIEVLAEISGVSQPTIIRFTNALGLKGYKELKTLLMQEAFKKNCTPINPHELINYPINRNDKIRDIPSKIISTSISLMEDTLKSISVYEYARAIEAIVTAKNIAIYGVENSMAVMQDLSTKLIYIGKNCVLYPDPYLQSVSAKNLRQDDIAIGISYTGCSKHTVECMKTAKEAGAKTVVITNFEGAIINKYADIVICASSEQYLHGSAIFSRCTQMAIIDMIYTGILLSDYDKYASIIEDSEKAISDFACKS